MSVENERKLLLDVSRAHELLTQLRNCGDVKLFDVTQGYLNGAGRIRHMVPHKQTNMISESFLFTYKARVQGSVVEIETSIDIHDYQKLFLIAKPWLVKTRAKLQQGIYTWDIDFFRTPKQGNIYLCMAEVEMPEFEVDCPDILPILQPYATQWVVNNDKRFNNKNLCDAKKTTKLLASLAGNGHEKTNLA